jgi:hypothetical protein
MILQISIPISRLNKETPMRGNPEDVILKLSL